MASGAAAARTVGAKHAQEQANGGGNPPSSSLEKPEASQPQQAVPNGDAEDFYVGWRKYQPHAERLYLHIYVQVGVAGLIGLNFIVNIVQAQIDPKGDKHTAAFEVWEWFFNISFLIELVLNMYATWCCRFWKSGWNIFDFFVVVIGWMFQLRLPLPGPLKLLRMMRAFRVFRLFKRVPSLRKILNSLGKAIPGVMNAFLIQLIVMSIYAIIGVDRFQDYGEGGFFINEAGDKIGLKTGRDQDFGFEYFGNFFKSLYTMFQVLTGESWSEVVTRPVFHSENITTAMGSAFFFVSFVILNAVVLINVVVAVLLEKMVDDSPETEDGEVVEDPIQVHATSTHAMVVELGEQMDNIVKVSADMQQQLADTENIKMALATLLAHKEIVPVAAI
jgi:hypothetical protein